MAIRLRRSRIISTQRDSIRTRESVVGQVREVWPIFMAHHLRMLTIDAWKHTELDESMMPVMPSGVTDEFRKIRENAPTPWGRLLVATVTQSMHVDDVKLKDGNSSEGAMELWERNGMGAKQISLHDSSATFGMAYNLILPATGRLDGKASALMRGKSAKDSLAFYRDDFDEYPEFWLEGLRRVDNEGRIYWQIQFIDEDAIYDLTMDDEDDRTLRMAGPADGTPHPMGLCPIIRFANTIDLSGRVVGEISPFITLFGRIDQDTQDRLVVQRYGAWAVRTIAGMDKPKTDADQAAARIALGIGDLLVAEDPETKFGSLPGTDLQGYISSREADIRDLAAVSQTPSFQLLGLSDNVGAEGLAAAKDATDRKIFQRRVTAGEAHEASLRLAGYAAGMSDVATDFSSRVHWRNDETQSFLTLAQALGQLASTVGIPPEMLWERIPDWTGADTVRAKELVKEMQDDALAQAQLLAEAEAEAAASAKPAPTQ